MMRDPTLGTLLAASLLIPSLFVAPPVFASIDALPAVQPALEQIQLEVGLTDSQTQEAATLILDRYGRVQEVVEDFGGVSFDTVVDLLVEARSVKEDFIPALRGILDDEQRQRLSDIGGSHDLWVALGAGLITEAWVDKLSRHVGLDAAQKDRIRPIAVDQFTEAIAIVEGIGDRGKKGVLDAVVDLRGIQRMTQRQVDRELNDEQKSKLKRYREETDERSFDEDPVTGR